jgi:hypothetical protein
MSPRAFDRRERAPPPLVLIALAQLILSGCSSIGDFGELKPELVTDNIHAWVGGVAAAHAGAPISTLELTDDERMLRDLAFPLIEPPYDRRRWDAVVYEYGLNSSFRRELWIEDPTAYYAHLQGTPHRSIVGRYNQLIDDVRNDIVRIEPLFNVAHRVLDIDRRRQVSMQHIPDLSPGERANAAARIGENSLTIVWVQHSLVDRCAAYRFALEHLVVAEPQGVAAEADRLLRQLQQQIASGGLLPAPHFAAGPLAAAGRDISGPR